MQKVMPSSSKRIIHISERAPPSSLAEARDKASLSLLVYWYGVHLDKDIFDGIFAADEQEEFERRLLTATKAKTTEELFCKVMENFLWQENDIMQVPRFKEFLVKRLVLWICFLPTLFNKYFFPQQSKANKALEKMVRVDWTGSVTVFVWVFLNVPTILYLTVCPSRSTRLDYMVVASYTTYFLMLTFPYVLREACHQCQERVLSEQNECMNWERLRVEAVHLGSKEKVLQVPVTDYLVKTSNFSISSLWMSYTPRHLEATYSRRLSVSDTLSATSHKRSNVYYQSISRQLVFLGTGIWFSSIAFLIPHEERSTFTDILTAFFFLGSTIAWYGLYGVLFNQMRKHYHKINCATASFRKATTEAQADLYAKLFTDNEAHDDNFFDFEIKENLEVWWLMREHILNTARSNTKFHNVTIGAFIVMIVLAAIALLLFSFDFVSFRNNTALLVYLFSFEFLLVSTLLEHLRTAVEINNNFHHRTLLDLRKIVFFKTRQLNDLIFMAESEEGNKNNVDIATKRRTVSNLSAMVTMMEKDPMLPGTILGVEIKRELIAKGVIAIIASCASAILRLGLTD